MIPNFKTDWKVPNYVGCVNFTFQMLLSVGEKSLDFFVVALVGQDISDVSGNQPFAMS